MKKNLFKDILKVKTSDGTIKYSQGRIYLFIFVLAYIACLGYYMFDPKTESMETIIDSIQWAILLFAGYVFAGKGVDATKSVFKMKTDATTPTVPIKPTDAPKPAEESKSTTDTKLPKDLTGGKKEEDLCT